MLSPDIFTFSATRDETGSKFYIGVCHERKETCGAVSKMGEGLPEPVSGIDSKSPGAAALKRRGGERPRKRHPIGCQVSAEKMSESEPSDDASSRIQGTVKTGAAQ